MKTALLIKLVKLVTKTAYSLIAGISVSILVAFLLMAGSISATGMVGGNTTPLFNQIDPMTKVVAGLVGILVAILVFNPKWIQPKFTWSNN